MKPRVANPAVRGEPRGIGSAGARDPLAREVRLLGALLGQVIAEQGGEELLDLVETTRRDLIARRREGSEGAARALDQRLDALDVDRSERLAHAFALYLQLVGIAEERHRVRLLSRRQRAASRGALPESLAEAMALLARHDPAAPATRLEGLRLDLVLTAHPTEARRRTILLGLHRVGALVESLDDPRLTRDEDAELRRRLREELTILWQTSAVRSGRPSPLDEVRTAMVFFDETLFSVAPELYRAADAAFDDPRPRRQRAPARDTGRTGTRPPRVSAFVAWDSWIGGDRDGNPVVTAAVTREVPAIHADHLLRGYERVAERLMQTVSPLAPTAPPTVAPQLAFGERHFPELAAELGRRFPRESYRRAFGFMAERLRRTRVHLVDGTSARGAYESVDGFHADVVAIQSALAAGSAERVAWGDVQDLRWQIETFGFHLASLEVRQHAEAHRLALTEADRAQDDAEASFEAVPSAEILGTFRAIAEIQARFGPAACHRYVVSFSDRPGDVLDVLRLAARAGLPEPIPLDVVPLLESREALASAGGIMAALLADTTYRRHLATRGDRQEVMLGYSDSNKESGLLGASWLLYGAQEQLVEATRGRVELTIFHGRGGAIGRGGGPANRAILAQAPGSIHGRLKLTEQGEVVAARYGHPRVAQRHLEQLAHAVLVGDEPAHVRAASAAVARWRSVMDELAESASETYRALVWQDERFPAFFAAVTPYAELAALPLASRPAARSQTARHGATGKGAQGTHPLAPIRAIPWVFAWSQNRTNLPGWYGVGTALRRFRERHQRTGARTLREMYRRWPFFAVTLENAELSLARADLSVAARYAALADERRPWDAIRAEHARTVEELLGLTGRQRLLAGEPGSARSIELRAPYVDCLSELQVRALARLRALRDGDAEGRDALVRLVHLTVSGVAAGIQVTG